jgi:hypothetical protein
MRRRHLYVFMFSVPGLFASLLVSFAVFGAAAGVLWLFVYGDEAWPPLAGHILMVLFAVTAVGSWFLLMRLAYAAGRRAEGSESLNRAHVLGAVLATVALPLVALFHQWRVGNIGPRTEGQACMDFCTTKGFSASAMPPRNSGERTCICLDAQGREAATLPIDEVRKF